jgi:L-seryl-tRNA(Ser) seleniumtransferase
LKRAVRLDKLALAALGATLECYLYEDSLVEAIPTLRLLTRPLDEIDACAHKAAALLRERLGRSVEIRVSDCASEPGSGTYPGVSLASRAVVITGGPGCERLFRHFLAQDPPIVGRIADDALVLDLRTVLDPAVFARVSRLP